LRSIKNAGNRYLIVFHCFCNHLDLNYMFSLLLGTNKKAKVLFDYTATAENQISLKTGQIISIVLDGGKGSWSKGVEIPSGAQ
jgi:hypothetical protein